MRIAQVSPLYERVPPQYYGGTERVVAFLTDALVELGHDVTLFATADSRTAATLVPCAPGALRLIADPLAAHVHHLLQLERVLQQASQFDIVHWHVDAIHYPWSRRARVPSLTTLHGRLDLAPLTSLYREYRELPVVSISDAQRGPLPEANWAATVHHGLPRSPLAFGAGQGGYLAFIGRISPEKRVDRAIAVARALDIPLKIAAKVDPADEAYFRSDIKPLLDQPGVEFIGEIGEADKARLLGDAMALLFPIDWPEPFGLVMIEALACGTPIVAYPHGAVPEIIDHGVTGFIVNSIDAAIDAVRRVPGLSRVACRHAFEQRFTAKRMASSYVDVYRAVIDAHRGVARKGRHPTRAGRSTARHEDPSVPLSVDGAIVGAP